MSNQLFLLILVVAASSGLNLIAAVYSWQQRPLPTAATFSGLMFTLFLWSASYLLELLYPDLTAKIFWSKMSYFGNTLVPVMWLLLSAQISGRDGWLHRNRPYLYLLFLVPLIILALVWTNDNHHLIWATVTLSTSDILPVGLYEPGPFYWLNVAHGHLLALAGFVLLTLRWRETSGDYRRQISLILGSAVLPWLGDIFYVLGNSVIASIDWASVMFTITGLIVGYSLFRYDMLRLAPIAYDVIVQNMADCVLVLDRHGRIVDHNHSAKTLWPHQVNLIGQTIDTLTSHWPTPISINLGAPFPNHEISLNDNHTSSHYEISSVPLRKKMDQEIGRLLILHNITERKQYEQALEVARDEAQVAANAKMQFLANMSHEIRTPLNAVVGMSELLRDTPLNAEQKELITTIAENSDHLLTIVNNLLDLSQMEAGSLRLEERPFSLRDVVGAAVNTVSMAARNKALPLQLHIPKDLPDTYLGDAVRLRQILSNLMANAVKFTETGQISLTIGHDQLPNDQIRLHFAIQDTGIGIDKPQAEQLFRAFNQADGSATRSQGGLGMGLAISYHLSRLMGGAITLESQPEQGSTFTVTAVLPTTTEPPAIHLNSSSLNLRQKRILILAPNAEERKVISQELRQAGMLPYVGGSISEGIYWLRNSQEFDMLLVDERIQEHETGYLLEQLLHEAQQKKAVVTLLTTPNRPLPAYWQTHFAAAISQPVNPIQLQNVLLDVLRQRMNNHDSAEPVTAVTQTLAERHPLRILLAEDNRTNQKVIERMLHKLGYNVDIARHGQEALDMLHLQPYDVVLMDIQMPVMDGVTATKNIQAIWQPPRRPTIIAVTAHAMEGDREQYLALGMDDYLSKPLQMDRLTAALLQVQQLTVTTENWQKPAVPPPANNGTHNGQTAVSTPTPIANSPHVDLETLESMIGSDAADFLVEMLPDFYESTATQLSQLHLISQTHKMDDIRILAHTIKGASASLGFTTLSEKARVVEYAARSADKAAILSGIADLQALFDTIQSELTLPIC